MTSGVVSAQSVDHLLDDPGYPLASPFYEVIAYAPSISLFEHRGAAALDTAKTKALDACKEGAHYYTHYKHDCGDEAWVHNGFVALAVDGGVEEGTPSGSWGTGWGHTAGGARYYAVRGCQSVGGTNCEVVDTAETLDYNPSQPTTGGPG